MKRLFGCPFLIPIVATTALACGDDSEPADDGGTEDVAADADADGDADPDADAQPEGDGEEETDVDDADVEEADAGPLTDNELLLSSAAAGPVSSTNLVGINAVAAPGERCRIQLVEGCRLIDCGWLSPDPVQAFDAGRVDLLIDGLAALTIQPSPTTGLYGGDDAPGLLYSAGDVVTFQAAGGDVPAFSREVTVPAAATVLSPPEPMTMVRTEPFTVTWEPTDGLVTVSGNQAPPGTPGVSAGRYFVCDVDGSLGTYSVPTSVLGVLGAGVAWLNICGGSPVDFEVGGYAVHLMVVSCSSAHSATVE